MIFLSGEDELGRFLRHKFFDKNGIIIKRYKKFSIWPSIKRGLKELQGRTQWLVYDGTTVDFWHDNWVGTNYPEKAIIQDQIKHSTYFSPKQFHCTDT